MAQVIAGFGVSHTAMTIRRYDPSVPEEARVRDAFERLRETIEALAPDLIVMVSSEHLKTFFYDNFPQLCIGVGSSSVGWGDAGVPAAKVPIAGGMAAHLLDYGVEAGFDLSWAAEPRLDHGFMCPLTLLTPRMDVPLVPIFQNSSTVPLPPIRRCAAFGKMIRSAIEARQTDERVVLLAAGGLSHWIATEEMGRISSDFDRWFLDRIVAGDLASLASLDNARVSASAGNGGQEIRNWITVMAAGSGPGELLCYEPVERWATGMAVARLFAR